MRTASQLTPISVQDYLQSEQDARQKHEYIEGLVYAMVGTTNARNTIAANATSILGEHLRGRNCRVFNSDTKIRIQ